MKTLKIKVLMLILSISLVSYAQKAGLGKGGRTYEKFSYVKTTDILLSVAEKGYKSVDLFEKLANAYYFNNKMEDAAKWYGELMNLNEPINPESYFRYAQALKWMERYEESDNWMAKFADMRGDELRVNAFKARPDYLQNIDRLSQNFEVVNMDLNTEYSDFGAVQYKDKLVFASTRKDGKLYNWNEQPYLELYKATKKENGIYENIVEFDENVNSKYHESSASFMPSEDLMFFTRNNFFKNKFRRDSEGINRLQLYSARIQPDGSWGEIESVHFNSSDHSVAHPALSVHGNLMVVASDMSGSFGNSDLWVVLIRPDGALGTPYNLGPQINTEGQETFPFLNEKGDLYFSSNGYAGLGGLDVYMVKDFENKYKSNAPYIVENVGRPVNSAKDDFAYYENLGTREGFFTSNRDGGKGDDDIYAFIIPECSQNIEGIVSDEKTGDLLPGSTVRLLDELGKELNSMTVGDDARYSFEGLSCEKEFVIRAEKPDFSVAEERFATSDNPRDILALDLKIKNEDEEIAIAEGTNIREALGLNPIYFDLDKSFIRPDAEIELQKVIAVMKQYPNMRIDVQSHTDSRASNSYNEALSTRRNNSTIRYLIEKGGIDPKRLSGRGYGESLPINKCIDGVDCEEAEHQQNRRSDFIVISIN